MTTSRSLEQIFPDVSSKTKMVWRILDMKMKDIIKLRRSLETSKMPKKRKQMMIEAIEEVDPSFDEDFCKSFPYACKK